VGFVGRYALLELVGQGGMGRVYRALDPRLQREVAVKVLYRGGAEHCARIEREARALARLSHPNVVAVYDVVRSDGRSFIAMELVQGPTLGQWMRDARRDPTEIVDRLIAAGRGLVAAHAAGVIHRDFKPGNVLLGADGRPRVTDFGLARTGATGSNGSGGVPTDPHWVDGETSLTVEGTVVGTPPYMAPEQHTAGHVDASCDQFAFCVTLYEALVGRRPYVAPRLDVLARAKMAHDPGFPEAIPPALVPVIRRGLSPEAGDRYASMADLLRALERRRRPQRRRWWLSAVPALATALWIAAPSGEPSAATEAPGSHTFEDDRVAAAVDRNLARAKALWDTGERRRALGLARAARARAQGHGAAIEGRAALTVGQIAWQLREADSASTALHEAYDALLSVHDDARATRAAITLAHLSALDLDRPDDARLWIDAAESLLRRGRVGKATRRDLQAALGDLSERLGDLSRAREHHETALALTLEIEGSAHPATVTYAMNLGNALTALGDYDAALRRLQDTRALAIDLLGEDAPEVGTLLANIGGVQVHLGQLEVAVPTLQHAQRLLDGPGHEAELAKVTVNLAAALRASGQPAAALAHDQRALALNTKLYGEDHPDVAAVHQNIGNAQADLGRLRAANESHARAVRIYADALGPEHPTLAAGLSARAVVLFQLGQADAAIALLGDAVDMAERTLGNDHPMVARYHSNLGACLVQTLRADEGLPHVARALAIRRASLGPEHPLLGTTLANLGDAHLELGHLEQAQAAFAEADRIARSSDPEASAARMHAQLGLMRVEVEGERADEALRRSAELGALLDQADDPFAHALWLSARSRAHAATGNNTDARRDASAAVTAFEALGETGAPLERRARAWRDGLDRGRISPRE